jgi:hypothetical protein
MGSKDIAEKCYNGRYYEEQRRMSEDTSYIDISNVPDLLRLVEEVRTTRRPHILRKNSEDLAVLMPVTPARHRNKRVRTKADYEAFRAAAGGWKGLVDTDKLIADIYESRRISTKPPVEL